MIQRLLLYALWAVVITVMLPETGSRALAQTGQDAATGDIAERDLSGSRLIDLINAARIDRRLDILRFEPRLAQIAADMVTAIYDGQELNGLNADLETALRKKGYPHMLFGGRYATTSVAIEDMISNWLEDSGSNGVLLNPDMVEIGVAHRTGDGSPVANMPPNIWAVVVADPARPAGDGWDRRILQLVNQFRHQNGLDPLRANHLLAIAAQRHAHTMVERDFFSHRSPTGTSPGDRASQAGYDWSRILENLAAGQRTPRDAVEAWIRSKDGHREAMLDPVITELGAGYVFAPFDPGRITARHYWVIKLGKPLR